MADTQLPKPDESQPVQPTFTPSTPAAPASPTPSAVSPSAAGLAAPGAQPSTQPTAPKASGFAGVPSRNINNAITSAKQSLLKYSQPAPLPGQAKAQPAAQPDAPGTKPAATTTPTAPAAPKPAAGGAGAGQPGAAPTTKPAATKDVQQASLDSLAPVTDTIKKMMEGDDPIAKIQYNQILNGVGPKNQAVLQGLGMKLAQSNLDGQGAGNALLEMMARDNEYEMGQLMSNVASDSAKRLADMNQWGFSKANEIYTQMQTQKRRDLEDAIKNGQFDTASSLWSDIYPGVPFDMGAAKASSPMATANFNSRMKIVDQFVSQGNAEQAKQMMDKLAEDMPEMFGFPNDPAAAKAAVAGIDFTTEAWQNNLAAQDTASKAARVAALQGDAAGVSSAVDQIFSHMTPVAVEGIATSAVKTRSLDEINKILAAAGMAPVASTDEAALIDKQKLAKAVKSYDLMQASKRDVVDNLLDTFTKADPAIGIDPVARQAAKAWLAMHAYGIATDPNTGAVTNFTLDDKATPPWDPSSPQAYMFNDWPVATFNPDGTVASRVYNGLTPYSDDYKPGDLTTAKGKEDARLDKAYEQYVFSTPADQRLSMEQWYYATAGGNKPANPELLSGSLKPATVPDGEKKGTYNPQDPASIATLITDFRKTGTLTDDMKTALNASGVLMKYTLNDLATKGGTMDAAGKLANNQYGGLVQLDNGEFLKVLPQGGDYVHHLYDQDTLGGGSARRYSWVAVEYNGKKYKVDNHGTWFPYDAVMRTDIRDPMPKSVPSPLPQG